MDPFEKRLSDLRALYNMFDSIRNTKIKDTLMNKLFDEVDYVVDNLETIYYDTIVRQKKWAVAKMHKEHHDTILRTKQTMQVFMPYMIAYNILNGVEGETQ
jgi:hypothetical protein